MNTGTIGQVSRAPTRPSTAGDRGPMLPGALAVSVVERARREESRRCQRDVHRGRLGLPIVSSWVGEFATTNEK